MPVEDAADRAAFLDPDDFGEAGTYTPTGGDPVSLTGIYEAPHDGIGFGPGVEMTASLPSFLCQSDGLPNVAAQGDALSIAAGNFTVKELQPDGSGITILTLTQGE